MRILVIAPQMALRVGLAAMLSARPAAGPLVVKGADFSISGEAASITEAASNAALFAEQADVVLLAGDAWPAHELERLAALKEIGGLLVLSDRPENAARALEAWGGAAWGLLGADASPEELAAALSAVAEGLVTGPLRLLRQVLDVPASLPGVSVGEDDIFVELTGREQEVLQCLAQGLANKQVGLALGISEHTVKYHVSAVYTKLGAVNRTEAVRIGLQKGLISL